LGQREKLILKILSGTHDSDILFEEICHLLQSFGFLLRVNGSHHIFFKNGIDEILNLQPKNGKVKAYQVKQIRSIIVKHELGGTSNV
jgi:predicted RNA binding protein YcfA (HicA-like mRNA interferase family)